MEEKYVRKRERRFADDIVDTIKQMKCRVRKSLIQIFKRLQEDFLEQLLTCINLRVS